MADDLTAPPAAPVAPVAAPAESDTDTAKADDGTIAKDFKKEVETSKTQRRKYTSEWKDNIQLRTGKAGASVYTGGVRTGLADDDRSEINPDWALTKTKIANLYSQVPQVQITHENKAYAAAIPPFAKALNYELGEKRANIGVPMEEVLNDVVNASGVAAILVGYAARFDTVMVPATDPMLGHLAPPPPTQPGAVLGLSGAGAVPGQPAAPAPAPMVPSEKLVSDMIFGKRISPGNLLWPKLFVGSCFDNADWVGYSDALGWVEAAAEWKLTEEDKAKLTGSGEAPTQDNLRLDDEKGAATPPMVRFDRLFYWRYKVDPAEKSFDAIWEIVFVEGRDEPVHHAPWKGQQKDEVTGKYIGACKFPLRFLTLTYISDNPIPPSDTSAGRAQVNDLRRSRSQMFQNRERSTPLRWFDVNRIDPTIQDNLQKGTVQGLIPTNGDGSRSIGEIARASYPAEDFSFDATVKQDLLESWQIGPGQMGLPQGGKKTKDEVNLQQQNFATRIGQERARVANFFLGVCDIVAGYLVLYSDFPTLTPEEQHAMRAAWDSKHIIHRLVLKIRPDSTIALDTQARIARLMQFLNMTAKSGFVNVQPVITEIAELSGLDPSEVVVTPQPKVEEPNFSFRASGKDDLMNPVVLAMLLKKKLAPSAEEIEQAKQLLMAAQLPPAPAAPLPAGAGGAEGAPGPHPPGAPPGTEPKGEGHPDWALQEKIAKRSRDIGGG